MRRSSSTAVACILTVVIGCKSCKSRPIDPEVARYHNLKTEQQLREFLAHSPDEQVELYLRVAAIPIHPSDGSLAIPIATQDGDIGPLLSRRLLSEKEESRLENLILLAGDYCYLNQSCRGDTALLEATETAYSRFADSWKSNPAVQQSLEWVRIATKAQPAQKKR